MQIFKDLCNLNIVVLMEFGSNLYGTQVTIDDLNEEEKLNSNDYLSDKDYKGVYIPTKDEIESRDFLKSISFNSKEDSKSKNTPDDIDCELYSIQYFIELALNGDTHAMDMLHCPSNSWIKTTRVWKSIVVNRSKFYTKSLKSFVDYARGQAAKYGVKGSRIADAQNVMKFLDQFDLKTNNPKLKEVWDQLPEGDHIFKIPPDPNKKHSLWMYEVCSRKAQDTAKVCYVRDIVKRFLDDYGQRARLAAKNKGVDWKAISHAVRAGFQLKELLTKGTITFPLEDREFIKKVKLGRFAYFCVGVYLDCMVDELEELNNNSYFPDKPNYEFWSNFLISYLDHYLDFRCNTCKYNIHIPGGTIDCPYPEDYCSKGNWDGIGPRDEEEELLFKSKKDPWEDCKDYEIG